ncbi:MAG TPA: hypothetical protein VET65_01800 [Candidatus Limnocylindrales bacterium]|nr:hypothetical protein [Candidatus Limnocylindrales bacterium]
MALRDPDYDQTGFPGLSDAQVGSLAEERLSSAILLASHGLTAVGTPLLDVGFDLYPRRVRTLRTCPAQVKARTFLAPSGEYQVSVASLHPDPNSAVLLPYLPPPDWQLAPRMWAMPAPDFLSVAIHNADGSYQFSGFLDGRFPSPANAFLVDSGHLQTEWLDRIPGWTAPIPPAPEAPLDADLRFAGRAGARAFGRSAELGLAADLMRAVRDQVAVVQDRLRLDCVDLLLHDLRTYSVAGLAIHACSPNHRGIVEFRIRHATFFTDPRLLVVVIPWLSEGVRAKQAFVIPSAAIPSITTASSDRGDGGYQGSFRLDPLAEKFKPFACAMEALPSVILERAFR